MGSTSNETVAYVIYGRTAKCYADACGYFYASLAAAKRFASVDDALDYIRNNDRSFGHGGPMSIQKIVRTEQTGETTEPIEGDKFKPEFVLRSRISRNYLSSPIYLLAWTPKLSEARKFFSTADALETVAQIRLSDVNIERIVETTSVTETAVDLS